MINHAGYLTEEIKRLREALEEALFEWEYSSLYKGEYLRRKHSDLERIEELRAKFNIEKRSKEGGR